MYTFVICLRYRSNFQVKEVEIGKWAKGRPFVRVSLPQFELNSIDVQFGIYVGFDVSLSAIPTHRYSRNPCRKIEIPLPPSQCNFTFMAEIKPVIGDDYPAVLHQIHYNKAKYLLVGAYSGVGATREQFVRFFESQGVKVIFELDVEQIQLLDFDREIDLALCD